MRIDLYNGHTIETTTNVARNMRLSLETRLAR
jgi:hypothetical protein